MDLRDGQVDGFGWELKLHMESGRSVLLCPFLFSIPPLQLQKGLAGSCLALREHNQ
jgi:hypothetical protein